MCHALPLNRQCPVSAIRICESPNCKTVNIYYHNVVVVVVFVVFVSVINDDNVVVIILQTPECKYILS